MAVYVYGLVFGDVTAVLPAVNDDSFSSTSKPVSTGEITQFIEDGAGTLNSAVLDRSSITASASLDEDTHAALKALVRAYAVAETAELLGMQTSADRARSVWEKGLTAYISAPKLLGAAYGDTYNVDIDLIRTPSSLDPPTADPFNFIGFDKVW